MANLDADTIVIGSGSGGLTSALALARAGQKVLVLEEHHAPGGWCQNFSKGGFTFSPGVHYIGRLGPGGETRAIYEGLGAANDLVFFEQNPQHYEHCHIAGVKFDYHADLPTLTERLLQRFPQDSKGIGKYMELLRNLVYQFPLLLEIDSIKDVLLMPYRTRHIGRYGLYSLKRILEGFISDPVVRGILSVQCGDQGLPPSRTMMMLHAGLARHYEHGGYYPRGGGGAIARALVKAIRSAGSEVLLGAGAEKILTESTGGGRRALGVRLADGKELRARHVISNADPHRTFHGLVGEEHLSRKLKKRLDKTRYSLPSLVLFLAVDMDVAAAGLDSGNIWYSSEPDFDKVFLNAQDPGLYDKDSFEALFISAPTLKDPTSYNGRGHTLEVVTFVGYDTFRQFEGTEPGSRPREYEILKQKIVGMFFNTLEKVIPGLSRHVVFCELGTPLTNAHYTAATNGCSYGTEKSYSQIGPMAYRVGTEIKGLRLVGASTVAHGVSGAAVSGLHGAASILGCKWPELLNPQGQQLQTYPSEDQGSWPDWLKGKIRTSSSLPAKP
jgi:phytoene dehydrogenase-like protein